MAAAVQTIIDPDLRVMRHVSAIFAATVAAGILIQSCFYTIEAGDTGLVARFGRLIDRVGPGLHVKLPFGIDYVEIVGTDAAREVRIDKGGQAAALITRDRSVVELSSSVYYQIDDPVRYLGSMRDPERFLQDLASATFRSIVARSDSLDLLTSEGQSIADQVSHSIQATLDRYQTGIRVLSVVVHDISPPEAARAAFANVDQARQEKEKLVNEATQLANKIVPEAQTAANQTLSDARTRALDRITEAKRDALAFKAVQRQYLDNAAAVRTTLYLDTVRATLPRAGKVVVAPGDSTSPKSIMLFDDTRKEVAHVE